MRQFTLFPLSIALILSLKTARGAERVPKKRVTIGYREPSHENTGQRREKERPAAVQVSFVGVEQK